MNRTTGPLLISILLLGSLQSMRPSPGNSAPAVVQHGSSTVSVGRAQPPSVSQGRLPRNEDGPWTALCHYFAAYDPEYFASQRHLGTNADHEPEIREAQPIEETVQVTIENHGVRTRKLIKEHVFGNLAACVPKTFHDQVAYLIATVPDPINTHMAMEYDRTLESIERAAATSGFNFDRYWVPWDELYAEHQQDLDKARAVQQDRHLREEEPGLFVFHASAMDATRPRILLVFLVGETPTYGINKVAFSKSLSYIHELNGRINGCHRPLRTLHVAGPTFSGSLDSLALELGTIAHDNRPLLPQRVVIVSGSVASSEAVSEFRNACKRLKQQLEIDFQEVVFPNSRELLVDHILKEIQRVVGGHDMKEIAFLSESTSVYGNTAGGETRPVAEDTSSKIKEVTRLTFPIGIAALRNAYQTAQENVETSNKRREQQLPQVTLPLSYRANEIPEQENLPVAATTQTPLSQDAVLQQITRTLRERDIKAVMIFATDALDSLFLLHYLRETCPDIRVALLGADLLFLRLNDTQDFSGTLVFDPYPLFSLGIPPKSFPADPVSWQSKFPSSIAQSQFLAVLSLLQPNVKYLSAKTGSTKPIPELWMGVMGKTAYWPIRPLNVTEPEFFRKCEEKDDDCTKLTSVLDLPVPFARRRDPVRITASYLPQRPTRLWYLLAMLITVGVFLHSFAILATRDNWFKLGDRWWLEYFALEHGRSRYVQARAFFLFVATIQAAIVQVVILVPTLSLNLHFKRLWESGATVAMLVGLGLALFVAFLNAIWVFRDYHQAPSRSIFSSKTELKLHDVNKKHIQVILRIAAIVSLLLSLAVVGTWGFLSLVSKDALAFSDRATAITSGVCPSLPILLIAAGLYTWAIGSLRRITYFQNRAAHFPVSHFDDIVKSDFEVLRVNLDKTLGPVSLPTSGTVWFIVSAVFCLFLYLWVGLHSLEWAVFNYVIFAGVWLLWATVLFSMIRLMHIWAVLKKILRRLERLPIRYAFSRIPLTFSWSPIWRRGGLRRSYVVQARSLEYLRCLSAALVPATQVEVQALGAAVGAASSGLTLVPPPNPGPHAENSIVTPSGLEEIRSALSEIVSRETKDCRITYEEADRLDSALLNAAEEMMAPLSNVWAKGGADGESEKILEPRQDLPSSVGLKPEQRQLLAAEFVALRFVAVFRYVGLQMRNLISMISLGFMLALLALKSYPFQPRERIGWWLVMAFICLGAALTYVFMEMDRDATLSRISKTDANKLDREFFGPLLRFGALPLLTIVAAQFPVVSSFLFSWVQPALDSLH